MTLFGPYGDLLPAGSERGRATVEVDDNTTVAALLDRLCVPQEGRRYVTVDGRKAKLTGTLRAGAEVRVIVPLGGG